MTINYNPNLPPNDSLTPHQIKYKVFDKRCKIEQEAYDALIQGGVPVSAAEDAAYSLAWKEENVSNDKAFQDATTWWCAKNKTVKWGIMTLKLKNHVQKKGKRISTVLKSKYGFDLTDLNAALMGDQAKLKAIGEAAKQGQHVQEFMPLLKEAYQHIIKGTEVYNTGIADILKAGANSAITIDKATAQTMLANQKYGNQRKELAADFATAKQAESLRHSYAIDYVQLKSYIDQYITVVDNDARLLDQTNRPQIKQIEEDKRFDITAAKHLLANGEASNLELLPHKIYVGQETEQRPGITGILNKVKAALGF